MYIFQYIDIFIIFYNYLIFKVELTLLELEETIMILTFLAGGISFYMGFKLSKQIHTQNKLIDARYQNFIQTKIDPLLGNQRDQQLQLLSSTNELPKQTEAEKMVNRELGVASANFALAIACQLSYPPLLISTVPAQLYFGQRCFRDGYHAVFKEKRVNVAVLDAILITWAILSGYWFAGVLSVFLVRFSFKILSKIKDNSRKNIINVFSQQPRFVWILTDGIEVEIPIHQIQVGNIAVVNASEVIPIDGIISEGIASIDQHVLTGESQPAEKSVGDPVFASTVVLSGKIYIKVEKAGQKTVVAQIGDLLNRTADYKTSLESETERFVDQSVLPTLVLSGLAFPVAGTSGALAVLMSSVGYSMRILAPLSTLNFLQIAAKNQILIKDGSALEVLSKVDMVVFDKTGTLTLEQPHVNQIYSWKDFSEEQLLTYTAAAEYRHTHPIAKAILATANERGLHLPIVEESCYEVGYGLKVNLADKAIKVGSNRFMKMENIAIPEYVETIQTECHRQGNSLIMIAINDELVGALELQATVRSETKEVIHWLRQQKISTAIISGDQEPPTQALAQYLGIEHYFANTLPEQKAKIITDLQKMGKTVCFVGDGINDSIALKKANVSVSLNGATMAAIDTAQVILMDKGLTTFPHLLDLARRFNLNQRRNLLISVIPNVLCIGGVFLFRVGFYTAIALFNGSLIAGIGNAMQPLLRQNTAVKKVEEPQDKNSPNTRE
ncbi:copper-transporting ATPase [Beggiatoa sp. PS]|nr:copper-transporting ATPase [Beggiatoa sp. PS]